MGQVEPVNLALSTNPHSGKVSGPTRLSFLRFGLSLRGLSSIWTKVKANELREILPGLIASDLSMAKKVKIRKKSKNWPGLAFLPWKTFFSVHVRARSDAGSPSGCCCCKARPRRMVSAVLMNTEKAFLTCLGDYKSAPASSKHRLDASSFCRGIGTPTYEKDSTCGS